MLRATRWLYRNGGSFALLTARCGATVAFPAVSELGEYRAAPQGAIVGAAGVTISPLNPAGRRHTPAVCCRRWACMHDIQPERAM